MKLHRLFVVAVAALVVVGCSSAPRAVPVTTLPSGHQLLAPKDAAALLAAAPAGLVVVDVRTPDEFAAGHIRGAMDIDYNSTTFADRVGRLDRNVPYFVYCHSGRRSAAAVALMQQLGFRTIYELNGGIAAWQSAGLAVA